MLIFVAAGLAVVSGGLSLVLNGVGAAVGPAGGAQMGGAICGGVISLAITGLLSYFLFRAAAALRRTVDTDGADQIHLTTALANLRNYFLTKGILFIIGIVVMCLVCGFAILMGAAVFGTLAR